jgi:hypothetical protein
MVVSAIVSVIGYGAAEAGVAATIGGAIAGGLGLEATALIVGETTLGSVIGGTVIGSGLGALKAAATGGDILQGALIGGVTSGVGSLASGAIGAALVPEGMQGPGLLPEIGGSTIPGVAVQRGLTGALTGALGSGLAGGDPLRGALLGGVSGGLSGAAGQALGLGSGSTGALGSALSTGLSAAFPTSQKTQSGGISAQTPYQPTISGKSAPGGSAALGSALSIAPGMGYSPSSTVFGSGESDKPKSNVWNVESLKGGAEVGPNVS